MTSRHARGREDARHAGHDHDHDHETDTDKFFRASRRKQNKRKNRQLCGQVQQTLSLALCANFDDEVLNELWVVKVEPTHSVSRLMIWVEGPRGSSAELILARLLGVAAALRAEVAAAICRKQVPMLDFAICDGELRACAAEPKRKYRP